MKTDFKNITQLCRELRKNSTEVEEILWQRLRNRQVLGKKFLRQYPIIYRRYNEKESFFIADFYCAELRLIVEVDGKIHDQRKEYDENRDWIMEEKSIRTVRFTNEDVKENMDKVIEKLENLLNPQPLSSVERD